MEPKKIPWVIWLSYVGWFAYCAVTYAEVTSDIIKKKRRDTVYSRKLCWVSIKMVPLFFFGVIDLPLQYVAPFLAIHLPALVCTVIAALWLYLTGVGFAWWFCLWRAKHVEMRTPIDMKRL